MVDSTDIVLYETIPEDQEINPQFKSLEKWVKLYLGPATAELHGLTDISHSAIKDENRNAIIPNLNVSLDDHLFYLSVKGCGAFEDMFFGGPLTPSKLKDSCHESQLITKLDRLSTGMGFIMGESWMGESPYGAQGKINAYDELNYSMIASKDSINGAHLCPVIGVVQLPKRIEELARKFFWFRTYQDHFFQVIRLVPSNIRLYFESNFTITSPGSIFSLFEVNCDKEIEKFELNFIKSGIALLSLYSRSAKVSGNEVTGITYQDVWFDKDCVVAPDGTIYFADIEGLVWKKVSIENMVELQKKEWQKLFYEFIYALFKIDSYRLRIQQREVNWSIQREELALLFHQALNKDLFTYLENQNNNLIICIEGESIPLIEVPILEMVNYI